MKNRYLIILIAAILILTGCANTEADSEPINLWIVTEVTPSGGMNEQVQYYIDQFQTEHPNVTVQLDILPYGEPQRGEYIKELHKKIEAGEGPDVYLLPNQDIVQNQNYWQIEPLFPDVELAMRAGIFADISRNYRFDFKLGKSALQKTVMDAGIVDGCRYVLPLRYEINTVYFFPDLFYGKAELDMESCTVSDLMQFAIDSGDVAIASSIDTNPSRTHDALTTAFSNLIDYDSGEVALSQQELEKYLSTYQECAEAYSSGSQMYGGVHLHNVEEIVDYAPVRVNTLMGGIAFSAYAKHTGATLKMAPLRTDDGDVVATVAYWGAIGSGCKNVDTAYEFLRIFLGEEAQWETAYLDEKALPSQKGYGWPVRAKGAAPHFYNDALEYLERRNEELYLSTYQSTELTDQDIPVLDAEINIVRFHMCNDFYLRRQELNDYQNRAVPVNTDVSALADSILRDLENTYKENLNTLPKIN